MPEIQGNSTVDRLDGVNQGVAFKAPVRCTTTGSDIGVLTGLMTLDGVTLLEGDRVLVKDQTDETLNGIYNASAGDWVRTLDANGNRDLVFGSAVIVNEGTANTRAVWALTCTDNPIVIDQSLLTWQPIGFATITIGALPLSAKTSAIEFIIFGSPIATGVAGDVEVPWDCTIDRVTLAGDTTGSIVVDIWVGAYSGYPPTVANTITAAAIPTIVSGTKYQDTTLTGWTKNMNAGQMIRYNVNSVSAFARCLVSIHVTKR
jgi:hypothetical protein